MINALITLLCLLIAAVLFSGGFCLAKYVVSLQHRVNVLEDSYKQAVEEIGRLERENVGLNQQIEHLQYEAQLSDNRGRQSRAWNPGDPLNSVQSRQ